jgi:phosphatidylinositol alpha-1,6-mannosyltransferase
VDTDLYHPFYDTLELRRELSIENERILLSVGRLVPRKGHSKVISILPNLIKTFDGMKYVIVGADLGEGSKLRKMAEDLGVGNSVIFTGSVPAAKLPIFYCLCDVLVMPNYELSNRDTEGFGMVFLEANACGKPVIGGLAGGTSDAVVHGQTGLLVDASQADALETACLALLTDKNYSRQLGENGRSRVLSQFRWEQAASEVRNLGLKARREYRV